MNSQCSCRWCRYYEKGERQHGSPDLIYLRNEGNQPTLTCTSAENKGDVYED